MVETAPDNAVETITLIGPVFLASKSAGSEPALMTTFTRDHLFQLLQSDQRNEFVELATFALGEAPQDVEIRLSLLRVLAEFGLLARARSVADGFDAALLQQPQFQELLSQLSGPQQNGLDDWMRYKSQFESNLAAIDRRYKWGREIRAAWEKNGTSFELHKTRDGRPEVFDKQSQMWRPCFAGHEPTDTVESIRRQVENRVIAPLVIEGLALGRHLPIFHAATTNTIHSASPYLYVVEPNWIAWAVALHLNDWVACIEDERVILCAGPTAYSDFADAVAMRPTAPPVGSLVRPPQWQPIPEDGGAQSYIDRMKQEVLQRQLNVKQRVEAKYADRDRAYWADRYRSAIIGDGPPLRVLSFTSRFTTVLQYATRDALTALESLGCETRILIEQDDQSHVAPAYVLQTIEEFEPDLVFLIDHTRQSQAAALVSNIPVLTWIQDRLPWLFDRKVGEAMGAFDFLMGQGREDLTSRYAYPPDRFFGCDMATDPLCLKQTVSPNVAEKYDCEVAFASHASETPRDFAESRLIECENDGWRAFVAAIETELTSRSQSGVLNGALNFEAFLTNLAAERGISLESVTRDALVVQFARPLAERLIRQQTIRWAANWANATGGRLKLYGRGWESHPEFSRFACGEVPHGAELGEAFRRACVNLHAGCNHALHQRVLDGLAAGGFFMIRRHGGDQSFALMRAIYQYISSRRLTPPATYHGRDLPLPWNHVYEIFCRDKGIDPAAPLQLNDQNLARLRTLCTSDEIVTPGQIWPDLEEVVFGNESEFVERLEYFLGNPDVREKTATKMREPVIKHFGYDALMRRTLEWLVETMSPEPVSNRSQSLRNNLEFVGAATE